MTKAPAPSFKMVAKARRDLVRIAHRHGHNLDPCRFAREVNFFEEQRHERIASIAERGDFLHRRQHVAEHLDAFTVRLRRHQRHTRDVPAWPCQACDKTCFDGVGDDCDNGNVPRRLLCGARAWCVESNEDIDLCHDQFGRQLGKEFQSSLRRANVERNVSSFDIACFRQSLPHLFSEGLGVSVSQE
jgi:hypothetical protein